MISDVAPSSGPFQTQLSRRVYFSAARENKAGQMSGHNFIYEATVAGQVDIETGMLLSIRSLDEVLRQVVSELDHRFLNRDVMAFKDTLPSTENLARYCYEKTAEMMAALPVQLVKARLYESDDLWVDYGISLSPQL